MSFKLTDEQVEAVRQSATGETFVLNAPAGCGKSSTAEKMIQAMGTDVLYLVFNRPAADDARKKMAHLRNVKVSTTSALAWNEYWRDYGERMNFEKAPKVPAKETARMAKIRESLDLGDGMVLPPTKIAILAVQTIDNFCRSADAKIAQKHVWLGEGFTDSQHAVLKDEIAKWAWKIWLQAIRPGSEHRFTQAYALKMLAMSGHRYGYDAIIIDEAQDSNRCVERLVKNQDCQTIAIGDPAQQIYVWNGASNIMDSFDGPRLNLTRSFRFGEAIAEEAEKHLAHTETGIRITGSPDIISEVSDGELLRPHAVLCRTNASAMEAAIEYLDEGLRVAMAESLVKRVRNLAFSAGKLIAGKPVDDPTLAAFGSWKELVAFTDEPGGGDLKALVGLIRSHGVGGIIDACKRLTSETAPKKRGQAWRKPDMVVSTAHTAKGREWGTVKIYGDFREPKPVENPVTGEMEAGEIGRYEAMLHYVAVTRARRHLDREGLKWIDGYTAVEKV